MSCQAHGDQALQVRVSEVLGPLTWCPGLRKPAEDGCSCVSSHVCVHAYVHMCAHAGANVCCVKGEPKGKERWGCCGERTMNVFVRLSHCAQNRCGASFIFHLKFVFILTRGLFALLSGREEGERQTSMQGEALIGCLQYVPGPGIIHIRMGDQTRNLGMCPDWESNPQLFSYRTTLYPTEPHQPGRRKLHL